MNDPWAIFDYEANMFLVLWRLSSQSSLVLSQWIHNAIVESCLLHLRQLCDIVLDRGKGDDDINLTDLVGKNQAPTKLEELRQKYGDSKTVGDPCWEINKMLVHPTKHRGSSYNYTLINNIGPILNDVITELRKVEASFRKGPEQIPKWGPNP